MKMRKVFAGMAAAVLAAATMAVSASAATNVFDVVTVTTGDDGAVTYDPSVGAMGFFMNGTWDDWNQGDWVAPDENGVLTVEFPISEIAAMEAESGETSLGMMGVMICNLPAESFPYELEIKEVSFKDSDGKVTDFDSLEGKIEGANYIDNGKESNTYRLIIRPTDETKDDGTVVTKAAAEAEGWGEAGAFKAGTLKVVIDMLKPAAGEESKADESKADESKADESTADESKAEETKTEENNGGNDGTTTTGTAANNTTANNTANNNAVNPANSGDNAKAGAAEGIALAAAAVAVAAAVASKKRK